MNHSITTKICSHLQHLALKAAEQTIDERGFWGLGEITIVPNLQSFSLTAEQKYQIQIVSSSKKILESWDESERYEDEITEPYYGTDWLAVCSMNGALRDLFLGCGLQPQFEFEIEHSANDYLILHKKSELKIHSAYHDFNLGLNLTDIQIDTLYEEITKLTLFSFMGR
jgi:hypothetical protein